MTRPQMLPGLLIALFVGAGSCSFVCAQADDETGESAAETKAVPAGPRETLKQDVADLRENPGDRELREKIIRLVSTMKPQPALPKEAQKPFYKAGIFFKEAKDNSGYEMAIKAYREALSIAPWWPDVYYNLAQAQGAAGQYDEAIENMKLYILTGPKDAEEAEKKIYALEAKKELAQAEAESGKKAAAEEKAKEPNFAGVWNLCSNDYGWPCPGNVFFKAYKDSGGGWRFTDEAGRPLSYSVEVSGRHLEIHTRNGPGWLWNYSIELSEDNSTMEGSLLQHIDKGESGDCMQQACNDTYHVTLTRK